MGGRAVITHTATLVRWATIAAAIGLTACAPGTTAGVGSDAPSVTSATSTSAPVGEPAGAWVAVLDTASDPSRLDGARKDVLRELGDVLEGSVVISPGSCMDGLPSELADGYVLAVQRESREDVRALVSQLSEEPSFTGDVTIMCSD
ncbi:MAG TPA: hypothetical protein VJ736_11910 [Actinomycetota bacterium]|nr:hypothetical protein [Actinomycetota bacterium]